EEDRLVIPQNQPHRDLPDTGSRSRTSRAVTMVVNDIPPVIRSGGRESGPVRWTLSPQHQGCIGNTLPIASPPASPAPPCPPRGPRSPGLSLTLSDHAPTIMTERTDKQRGRRINSRIQV